VGAVPHIGAAEAEWGPVLQIKDDHDSAEYTSGFWWQLGWAVPPASGWKAFFEDVTALAQSELEVKPERPSAEEDQIQVRR
jgi:hypothetical protein